LVILLVLLVCMAIST